MIRVMPNVERPVDSTTCAPAAATSATALATFSDMFSEKSTSVPSMSSATSLGFQSGGTGALSARRHAIGSSVVRPCR